MSLFSNTPPCFVWSMMYSFAPFAPNTRIRIGKSFGVNWVRFCIHETLPVLQDRRKGEIVPLSYFSVSAVDSPLRPIDMVSDSFEE